MKKFLALAIWTYLVFVLHSGLASRMAIAGHAPHFVLAGLLLVIVCVRDGRGMGCAILWGLLSDGLADGPLGPDVACFGVSAFVLQRIALRSRMRSLWGEAAVFGILVWTAIVGSNSLRWLAEGRTLDVAALGGHAAGSAIYTAFVMAIVSWAARLVLDRPEAEPISKTPTVVNHWRMLTG